MSEQRLRTWISGYVSSWSSCVFQAGELASTKSVALEGKHVLRLEAFVESLLLTVAIAIMAMSSFFNIEQRAALSDFCKYTVSRHGPGCLIDSLIELSTLVQSIPKSHNMDVSFYAWCCIV